MLQWGVGKLFNIDIPPLSNNRWDFLQSRKVWKKDLEDRGGSYLGHARSILAASNSIPPDKHPPPLFLLYYKAQAVTSLVVITKDSFSWSPLYLLESST